MNNIDDDLDGLVDNLDPGCSGNTDPTEQGTGACDDGFDNDGDGKVDYKTNGTGDPGCISVNDSSEFGTAVCDNNLDDDTDGTKDFRWNASNGTSPAATGDLLCFGPTDATEN